MGFMQDHGVGKSSGGTTSIPGTTDSGNTVDDKPVQWWTGQATPDSMQTNLAPATQGVASLANTDWQSQARGYQSILADQLLAQSQGKAPSLAMMALQQGTDQNLRQQAGLAAGGRNPGLASYQAGQNQSVAGQQMAGQGAMARLQEQQQAQQGLAGLAGQMRQGDIGLTEFDAQQQQQMALANMGALNQYGMQQGQMSQAALQYYNAMMSGQLGSYNQYQYGMDQQQQAQDAAMKQAMIGGLFSAGGVGLQALATKSDERAKTDIQDARPQLYDMLDHLGAHDYEYKDPSEPGAAPGRHVSVMAQELEQSELGKRFVTETPTGKIVDYGRGFGTMLAAMSDLHRRTKELERRGLSSLAWDE